MTVLELYEINVSTVYFSNGFSILFSVWKKCLFGLYFNVFQLLPPTPEPCMCSRDETGEGSMLGERAGFQTDSPWSITKGFSPALCFLLAVKAAPTWPVEQVSPVAFLSALLCPVLLASFQYWLLTSTHPNKLLAGKTIWQWFHSHKTLPNVLKQNEAPVQLLCAQPDSELCLQPL